MLGSALFAAVCAAGGLALWGAMREGWIGWEVRRRKPSHAARRFAYARRVGWEVLDTFEGVWEGLKEWFPVLFPFLWLVVLVALAG